MARQNRCEVFNPRVSSIVHCVNRVVRRAMLCGVCPFTGQSFEHRRGWLKRRLQFLAQFYAIDILVYTVMANHFHVILRNRPDIVDTWSDEEIAIRIWNLFPKRRTTDGLPAELNQYEIDAITSDAEKIEKYRSRLSDVSWLMKQLAEEIARRSNKEDGCTGHFWEGRFKCQPLLDDKALLACAAYVDLNPVRAAMAETPELSDFTSIQDRIVSAVEETKNAIKKEPLQKSRELRKTKSPASTEPDGDHWLSPIQLSPAGGRKSRKSSTGKRASDHGFLKISREAYFRLVDWTGRMIAKGKRGRIPNSCKPILERLGLEANVWCEVVKNFGRLFKRAVGSSESIRKVSKQRNQSRYRSSGGPALLA